MNEKLSLDSVENQQRSQIKQLWNTEAGEESISTIYGHQVAPFRLQTDPSKAALQRKEDSKTWNIVLYTL